MDVVLALVLLGLGAGIGAWLGRSPSAGRGAPAGRATGTDVEASGSDPFGHASVTAGDRMRASHELRNAPLRVEELNLRDARQVDRALADVGLATGAREVIFWEWSQAQERLRPRRWSDAAASRPQHFRMDAWGPLVQWAAEERITHCKGDGDLPVLSAAPVLRDGQLLGVVSASADAGLLLDRRTLGEWMPRHAARIADALEHARIHEELRWREDQHRTLLSAAEKLRTETDKEPLLRVLGESALELTGGTYAALVHWREDERTGSVQYATPGLGVAPPHPVVEGSLVEQASGLGPRLELEDLARLAPGQVLFGPGERFAMAGSLAIKPLRRGRAVIGALVVASDQVGLLNAESTRGLDLLEAPAVSALELVWEAHQATERAEADALTGLHNRAHFDRRFREELRSTDRYGGSLSLVLVDVDFFKRVNDQHGHEAGDEVLKHVARVLSEGVREVDLCARVGGEEIALLLPRTDHQGAVELAERLRKALQERPARHAGLEIKVTASFGVATYPEVVRRHEALYVAADRALYAAKHAGRNQVRAAQPSDVRGRS